MAKDLTIEEIRERKRSQLLTQFENDKKASEPQLEKSELESREEKNDLLLRQVLVNEAYLYFKQLPIELQEKTLSTIKMMLSSGELSYGYQITMIGFKRLERKILGIKPSITIRRRGKDDVKLS